MLAPRRQPADTGVRTGAPQSFAVDHERVGELVREDTLLAVGEGSLSAGEEVRQMLEEAIGRGALVVPAGVEVLIESADDEEGSFIRFALRDSDPQGLEHSRGWVGVARELTSEVGGALECTAAELGAILAAVGEPGHSATTAGTHARCALREAGVERAAGYRHAGEEVTLEGPLSVEQLRRVEAILGHPRLGLGRHKPHAEKHHFEPQSPRVTRALCAYLREQRLTHEHEIAHRFTAAEPASEGAAR